MGRASSPLGSTPSLKGLGVQTATSLALRAFQLGSLLFTTVLLARVLGPSELGAYAYGLGWLWLLAGFATAGFAHASVREVAKSLALERYDETRSHIATAYVTTLVLSVGLVSAVLLASRWLFAPEGSMAQAATIGVALAPLLALTLIAQAVLRGQGLTVRAQLGELLVLPALMLLATWLAWANPAWRTASRVLYLHGACLLLTLATGLSLQWRALPPALRRGSARLESRWLLAALPFVLVLASAATNAQFDVLTVGDQLGARLTGVYAFAVRLSTLPALVPAIIAMPLSPVIAAIFAKQEREQLRSLVELSSLVGALGSALLAAAILLGAPCLNRVIDPSYAAGRDALFWLCAGRVAEAWFGPSGTVLAMTKYAWPAGIAVALAALASVGLNLLLVGPLGIVGAAYATAASCVIRGGAMWYWLRRHEGIGASAPEALVSVATRALARRAARPPVA